MHNVSVFYFYLPARTATIVRCPIFNTAKSQIDRERETDKEREREHDCVNDIIIIIINDKEGM